MIPYRIFSTFPPGLPDTSGKTSLKTGFYRDKGDVLAKKKRG
jgi:hypothetical protein